VESYRLPDREAMLVTGGDDGTARLWNCETGAEALRIPLGLPVHDLAVIDGDLVLATEEGPVQVSLEAPSNLMGES
jgi:WD40 repeat protein